MSKEVSFWAPSIIFVDILPRNYDLARSEQYFSYIPPIWTILIINWTNLKI